MIAGKDDHERFRYVLPTVLNVPSRSFPKSYFRHPFIRRYHYHTFDYSISKRIRLSLSSGEDLSLTYADVLSELHWQSEDNDDDDVLDEEEYDWEELNSSSSSDVSGRPIRCEVVPMSDEELEYLEQAHSRSRLLSIYREPSLRFITVPPVTFVTPKIPGESGYQSENSPPVASHKTRFGPTASIPSGSKLSDLSEVPSVAGSARSSVSSSKPLSPPPSAPLNTAGHFEVSKMDVLSEEIWHYHNSVTQTDAMLNQKLHLRDLLYYSICPVFPMCGLYVVGSSLNGFGNNSSDMDLCLMITNKDLDQKTDAVVVLNMILNALSQLEWVASQKLILAKVPILRIKFSAPFSDITVDLNANNSVAIKNTHLLCYYSSFDWRVRPLVSVVKEWAKRKGINDANRSSFTSYSLVLMVIHYLQCGADPPVLPSLQQMYPKMFSPKCDVRTLNVTQALPAPTDDWEYSDKCTLGELLIGFLDYYANKFNYDRDAISVRQGKRVDRASLARHKPAGMSNVGSWRSQWRCICIEEPFTLSNTAHSIYDEMVFGAIKNAFREAHVELEQSRDLQKLLNCKSITVNAPMGGAVVYSTSYDGTRTILSETSPSPPTSQPNMSLMPSGSANSLNTAQSGSSASSSNGDEPDEHPNNERMPSINAGIIIRRPAGNRNSGRRRQTRKSADVPTTQMAACRT